MGSIGWEGRVNAAQTAAEVIVIAREFMASLDDFENSQLPFALKPRNMNCASDITSYAFDLLAYETSATEGAASLVSKLAMFFAYASHRLARFHAPSPRFSDEEVRSFVPKKPSETREP